MNAIHLREIRKSLGMTQKDIAEALGVSRSFYALMETGKREVSDEIAAQIVRMGPDTLVDGYQGQDKNRPIETLNEPAGVYSVTPQYVRKNFMSLIDRVDAGQEVVISVGAKKYRLTECDQPVSPTLDSWFERPENIAMLTARIREYESGREKTMSLDEARELWANTK